MLASQTAAPIWERMNTMKRFLNRRNDRRSAQRSDIVPELISRYGMQLLDNVSRLRDAWPPRWLK